MLDRRRPAGRLVAAPQPPGRRGRVPRAGGGTGEVHATRARPAPSRAGCCSPRMHMAEDDRMMLGYQCANSRMTVVGAPPTTSCDTGRPLRGRSWVDEPTSPRWSSASTPSRATRCGSRRSSAYHTSRGLPVRELSDRCERTLDRAARYGARPLARRAARLVRRRSGRASDVEIDGRPDHGAIQQAIRLEPVPRSRRPAAGPTGTGSPAKGVTGSGYEGHYFWDSEVYVAAVPHATRAPSSPATLLHFRSRMLPRRARPGRAS